MKLMGMDYERDYKIIVFCCSSNYVKGILVLMVDMCIKHIQC